MQMTLAAIQFHPTIGDRTKNLQRIEHLIAQAVEKGAQLILLPETCDLGYDLATIQRLAEPFPNPSTETFAGVAEQQGITIVAGLAERRGKNIFVPFLRPMRQPVSKRERDFSLRTSWE